jgi:hypothetical protein
MAARNEARFWALNYARLKATNATFKEVTGRGLAITNKDGNEEMIGAGNIITALPILPSLLRFA